MYKRDQEINLDAVAEFLKDTVVKVKTTEDADVLTELKKVFKKNVPLTLRSYVAAYLVKESARHYRPSNRNQRRDFRDNTKSRNERPAREQRAVSEETRTPAEERQPRPRVQIDPNMAATIFISIGRNRRVFPRDLVGLLVSVAGLDRDRIGDIRVLANYSFVQLFSEDSEKAINALNGYDYRGRKLAVSYSRQKDEESEDQETADQMAQDAEDAAAYAAATKAAQNEPFAANIPSTDDTTPSAEEML